MATNIPAVDFLIKCDEVASSNPEGLSDFVKRKVTGEYYYRYGFLDKDGSGLSNDAKKIIEYASTPENLIPLLAEILSSEPEFNGAWILLQKAYPSPLPQTYQFEANRKSDSTFVYAVFLFELGILDYSPMKRLKTEQHKCYRIPFSSRGRQIIEHSSQRIPDSPQTKAKSLSEGSPITVNIIEKFTDKSTTINLSDSSQVGNINTGILDVSPQVHAIEKSAGKDASKRKFKVPIKVLIFVFLSIIALVFLFSANLWRPWFCTIIRKDQHTYYVFKSFIIPYFNVSELCESL